MYILFALVAACGFAVSSVVKHRSAQDIPESEGRSRGLTAIVTASVRHPLWLAGIATDAVALICQIVALHLGPIAVVQPLLVTSLIVALLLSRRGRLRYREMTWPLVVVLALAVLSVVADTPHAAATTADVVPAGIGLGVTAFVIAAGLRMVAGHSTRPRSAMVLGIGVGVIYAATAALLKALSTRATEGGVLAVVDSWELYVLLVAGAAGLVLNQAAFRAGPLSQSLPAISAVDPLVSIGIGIVIYDERLRAGGLGLLVVICAALVLGLATVRLSKLQAFAENAYPVPAPVG